MTLNQTQFEQLPMFATAREIHDNYGHDDQWASENTDDLYNRKLEDVRNPLRMDYAGNREYGQESFEESVRNEGVATPVFAGVSKSGRKALWDGHHRVAIQHAVDPDRLVPIKFGALGGK